MSSVSVSVCGLWRVGDKRLGGVVAGQVLIAKPLPALIADDGARLSGLDGCDARLRLRLVLFVLGQGGLDVVEGLVLVLLEPFEGSLDWWWFLVRGWLGWWRGTYDCRTF